MPFRPPSVPCQWRARIAHAAACALVAALAACRSATAGDEAGCRQTYEFGNYRCAIVVGHVLGAADQPLPDIIVAPAGPRSVIDQFDFPVDRTDRDGRFSLTFHRMQSRADTSGPDTATIFVMGSTVPEVPRVADSASVRLSVFPIGVRPVPETVLVRLRIR